MKKRKVKNKKNNNKSSSPYKNYRPKPKKEKLNYKNYEPINTGDMRLNKYISDSGFCSRREADKYIGMGKVRVNGKLAGIGSKIDYSDKVTVNNKPINVTDNTVYICLNKPVGITSTTERGVKDNIVDFVGYHERIFPIGRLDKDSEGLILLTNDGNIVNKILRAENNHEKEYIVRVNKKITDDFITKMENGIPMLGTVTKKCRVNKMDDYTFNILLTQGLNRQIRRMCEHLDYKVVALKRIRIMNIELKKLPIGEWRFLSDKEVKEIKKLISSSKK